MTIKKLQPVTMGELLAIEGVGEVMRSYAANSFKQGPADTQTELDPLFAKAGLQLNSNYIVKLMKLYRADPGKLDAVVVAAHIEKVRISATPSASVSSVPKPNSANSEIQALTDKKLLEIRLETQKLQNNIELEQRRQKFDLSFYKREKEIELDAKKLELTGKRLDIEIRKRKAEAELFQTSGGGPLVMKVSSTETTPSGPNLICIKPEPGRDVKPIMVD